MPGWVSLLRAWRSVANKAAAKRCEGQADGPLVRELALRVPGALQGPATTDLLQFRAG